MKKKLGICGHEINCTECPAYIAYNTDDNDLRIITAKIWSQDQKAEIQPEHINCSGCLNDDQIEKNIEIGCEIRACGLKQNLTLCSDCIRYPCKLIIGNSNKLPADARVNIEKLRKEK